MADDKPLANSQLTTQELSSSEQWRILQASLTTAHNSIINRDVSGKCRDNTESDISLNFVELSENLSDKSRCVSNEDENGDYETKIDKCRSKEVDETPKFVDLREKLMEKRRRISNESKNGYNLSELDVRRKFGYLGEKLNELERSLFQGNEKICETSDVIEQYNELYAAFESNEKQVNEEIKEKCEALNSKEKDISKLRRVFELKERELKYRHMDIDERIELLDVKENKLEEFRRVLELKEKDIIRFQRVLKVEERVLKYRHMEIDERIKLVEVKEKTLEEFRTVLESKEKNLLGRLELKEKLIEERFVAVKSKEIGLELKEKAMEERCGEIKLKEELAMSELCKAVEWKLKQMDKRFDAIEMERNRDLGDGLKRKEISDADGRNNVTCSLKLSHTEIPPLDNHGVVCSTMDGGLSGKQIDEANDTHGVVCSTVDGGLRGKQINDANDGLRFKEKIDGECGVDDECQETEKEEKQYNAPREESTLMDTKVNEYIEPQAVIEKQTNKCSDKLESKEKEVSGEFHGIVSGAVDSSSVPVCSDIHMLCKKMDAYGVRSYMVRCVKEQNILHDKIFVALRSTSSPTKLVHDISRSFFEENLDIADSDANKTGCIHLLEQLIKLSAAITPDVENEARDFTVVWKGRINLDISIAINHYGFLHFVAAYKLAKYYNAKQLLSIFKASYFAAKLYPSEKNVDLSSALVIQDEIPGFIRSLIKKQKQPEAVKCIYLFKLESDFPPVPLIEAYVEVVKQKVNERLEKEISRCWKVDAVSIELSLLYGALSYISSLKLPYIFPTDSLSLRINELKQNGTKKMIAKSLRKRGADLIGTPAEQLQKRPRAQSTTPSLGNTSNTMPNV